MSNEPQDQREEPNRLKSATGGREPPQNDIAPPKRRHSSTPFEDAEWEGRMDELEVERGDLDKNQVVQPATIDPQELASIVKRLEVLAATSKEFGREKTHLNAHLEEALVHLNQAVSELAEKRGN